jgi:hypothetical protein
MQAHALSSLIETLVQSVATEAAAIAQWPQPREQEAQGKAQCARGQAWGTASESGAGSRARSKPAVTSAEQVSTIQSLTAPCR